MIQVKEYDDLIDLSNSFFRRFMHSGWRMLIYYILFFLNIALLAIMYDLKFHRNFESFYYIYFIYYILFNKAEF